MFRRNRGEQERFEPAAVNVPMVDRPLGGWAQLDQEGYVDPEVAIVNPAFNPGAYQALEPGHAQYQQVLLPGQAAGPQYDQVRFMQGANVEHYRRFLDMPDQQPAYVEPAVQAYAQVNYEEVAVASEDADVAVVIEDAAISDLIKACLEKGDTAAYMLVFFAHIKPDAPIRWQQCPVCHPWQVFGPMAAEMKSTKQYVKDRQSFPAAIKSLLKVKNGDSLLMRDPDNRDCVQISRIVQDKVRELIGKAEYKKKLYDENADPQYHVTTTLIAVLQTFYMSTELQVKWMNAVDDCFEPSLLKPGERSVFQREWLEHAAEFLAQMYGENQSQRELLLGAWVNRSNMTQNEGQDLKPYSFFSPMYLINDRQRAIVHTYASAGQYYTARVRYGDGVDKLNPLKSLLMIMDAVRIGFDGSSTFFDTGKEELYNLYHHNQHVYKLYSAKRLLLIKNLFALTAQSENDAADFKQLLLQGGLPVERVLELISPQLGAIAAEPAEASQEKIVQVFKILYYSGVIDCNNCVSNLVEGEGQRTEVEAFLLAAGMELMPKVLDQMIGSTFTALCAELNFIDSVFVIISAANALPDDVVEQHALFKNRLRRLYPALATSIFNGRPWHDADHDGSRLCEKLREYPRPNQLDLAERELQNAINILSNLGLALKEKVGGEWAVPAWRSVAELVLRFDNQTRVAEDDIVDVLTRLRPERYQTDFVNNILPFMGRHFSLRGSGYMYAKLGEFVEARKHFYHAHQHEHVAQASLDVGEPLSQRLAKHRFLAICADKFSEVEQGLPKRALVCLKGLHESLDKVGYRHEYEQLERYYQRAKQLIERGAQDVPSYTAVLLGLVKVHEKLGNAEQVKMYAAEWEELLGPEGETAKVEISDPKARAVSGELQVVAVEISLEKANALRDLAKEHAKYIAGRDRIDTVLAREEAACGLADAAVMYRQLAGDVMNEDVADAVYYSEIFFVKAGKKALLSGAEKLREAIEFLVENKWQGPNVLAAHVAARNLDLDIFIRQIAPSCIDSEARLGPKLADDTYHLARYSYDVLLKAWMYRFRQQPSNNTFSKVLTILAASARYTYNQESYEATQQYCKHMSDFIAANPQYIFVEGVPDDSVHSAYHGFDNFKAIYRRYWAAAVFRHNGANAESCQVLSTVMEGTFGLPYNGHYDFADKYNFGKEALANKWFEASISYLQSVLVLIDGLGEQASSFLPATYFFLVLAQEYSGQEEAASANVRQLDVLLKDEGGIVQTDVLDPFSPQSYLYYRMAMVAHRCQLTGLTGAALSLAKNRAVRAGHSSYGWDGTIKQLNRQLQRVDRQPPNAASRKPLPDLWREKPKQSSVSSWCALLPACRRVPQESVSQVSVPAIGTTAV